jgi:hypothetical protein
MTGFQTHIRRRKGEEEREENRVRMMMRWGREVEKKMRMVEERDKREALFFFFPLFSPLLSPTSFCLPL